MFACTVVNGQIILIGIHVLLIFKHNHFIFYSWCCKRKSSLNNKVLQVSYINAINNTDTVVLIALSLK